MGVFRPGRVEGVILKTASNETPLWDTAPDEADPPDPPDEADEADPADRVSLAAARNHPSTCAGGQDDVSSQANSLK